MLEREIFTRQLVFSKASVVSNAENIACSFFLNESLNKNVPMGLFHHFHIHWVPQSHSNWPLGQQTLIKGLGIGGSMQANSILSWSSAVIVHHCPIICTGLNHSRVVINAKSKWAFIQNYELLSINLLVHHSNVDVNVKCQMDVCWTIYTNTEWYEGVTNMTVGIQRGMFIFFNW